MVVLFYCQLGFLISLLSLILIENLLHARLQEIEKLR